jgi:hypothetical protein
MPSVNDLRDAVEDYRRLEQEPPTNRMIAAARVLGIDPEYIKQTKIQVARIRITDTAIAFIEERVNASEAG